MRVGKCRLQDAIENNFLFILGINTKALERQRDRHTSGHFSQLEQLEVNVSPETINMITYENQLETGSYFII